MYLCYIAPFSPVNQYFVLTCLFCAHFVTDNIRKSHMNHVVEWILFDVVSSFLWSHRVLQQSRCYIRAIVENMKPLKRSFCVGLLLASKEEILLLHLLHAEAGLRVLFGLTLLLCGPVLHPGSLTQNILKPAEVKGKSVVALLFWHHSHITKQPTLLLFRLRECLSMNPWAGRFFLWSDLKIPCSGDSWGMGVVFPEEPRQCFLKGKASCSIHTGITWQFPNFSSVEATPTEIMTNTTKAEAATWAGDLSLV